MARSFNGSTDVIKTANFTFEGAGNSLSIAAWIYPTVTNFQAIVGADQNGGVEFRLNQGTDTLSVLAQGLSVFATSSGSPLLNTWTHVGFTNVGSTSAYVFYINGATSGSGTGAGGTPSLRPIWIGSNLGSGEPFTGRIADLAMWTNVQPASTFTSLSQGARPYNFAPTSYWPLDGLASPEPDFTGAQNNGTLTGTALAPGPPVMQFTPRWPQFLTPPVVASAVVFRKTLSQVGGRVGTRQPQGWAG